MLSRVSRVTAAAPRLPALVRTYKIVPRPDKEIDEEGMLESYRESPQVLEFVQKKGHTEVGFKDVDYSAAKYGAYLRPKDGGLANRAEIEAAGISIPEGAEAVKKAVDSADIRGLFDTLATVQEKLGTQAVPSVFNYLTDYYQLNATEIGDGTKDADPTFKLTRDPSFERETSPMDHEAEEFLTGRDLRSL